MENTFGEHVIVYEKTIYTRKRSILEREVGKNQVSAMQLLFSSEDFPSI